VSVARRIAAPWVLPVEAPPIENGAVLIGSDGRIAAVGPNAVVPEPPGVPAETLAGAAVLPGLINTHTHLELTGLDGQVPEQDFPAWIRRIIALKSQRTPAEFLAAARQGIRDGWAGGVTTVADTGDSGAVVEALSELGASGIAYQEVFGPDPDWAEAAMEEVDARLASLARFTGPRVRLGISPHAPYSVSGLLYAQVAAYAAEHGLPVAVHVAESEDESLLLARGAGGFARSWESRAIPLPPPPGRTPVAWLDQHGVLGPRTLCIHVVRAGDADLEILARRGAAVAHCPRSNRRHGHGAAPLARMLRRGLRVGVGTDSVASVSPMDLLAEARLAREVGELDADSALRLATLDAARALGVERDVGSLRRWKWGDLAVVDLPGAVDAPRLAGTLLARAHNDVRLTLVAGREVYRRGQGPIG
jgi:cytosine/adenosine deaminase-related metal-dependent hydrolase